VDLRKWAAEGLAYLTLDADVKEDLVEDTDSLKSIIDLSKVIISFIAAVFVSHNYRRSSSLTRLCVTVLILLLKLFLVYNFIVSFT